MKKILFLLSILIAFSFCANSQVYNLKSQYNLNVDTVDNSATNYLTSGTIGSYKTIIAVQLLVVEISGTTDGTATLQGSLDGTNWYSLSDSVMELADNTSQVFSWHIYNVGDPYIRVAVTGTGTMSDKISAKYITR